jgi:glutathione S-transferase
MKLLGTTTSPHTRKARILLKASRRPHQFVDTRTEEGAALLAAVAPLGKVPVLVLPDPIGPLADSTLITNWLWTNEGFVLRAAGFTLDSFDWADRELYVVVEGALDAAINHRYLRVDGFNETGYIAKQRQRVDRTLGWLDARRITFQRPLSASALSLGCALDWIVFRNVVDLARFPALAAFRDAWQTSGVGAGTEPKE